jgi:hypothetical protein
MASRLSVFIDSDVFILALRYPQDKRSRANGAFLEKVRSGDLRGMTSIHNVLEVSGILSFNLPASVDRLITWSARHFRDRAPCLALTSRELLAA